MGPVGLQMGEHSQRHQQQIFVPLEPLRWLLFHDLLGSGLVMVRALDLMSIVMLISSTLKL